MTLITLENTNEKGERLLATFHPNKGMNMVSFKKEGLDVIDQQTMPLFEERLAGLGPLIGPHFHHRAPFEIPLDFDTHLFPHIARVKKKGVVEPFSHGIARYVPWRFDASSTQIEARLSSSDLFKGIPLRQLEGMDFEMQLHIALMPFGLFIKYSVKSEKPSVIGLHTYYHLPDGKGKVDGNVVLNYRESEGLKPLPDSWHKNGRLNFDLSQEADFGFFPKEPLEESRFIFSNRNYDLHLFMQSDTSDCSFQIFRPAKSTYVCLEPLSSQTPRAPTRCESSLEIKLEIF